MRLCQSTDTYILNMRISEYANIRICERANIRICEYPNMRMCEYPNMRICESAANFTHISILINILLALCSAITCVYYQIVSIEIKLEIEDSLWGNMIFHIESQHRNGILLICIGAKRRPCKVINNKI